MASAALPSLYQAVKIGKDHYWDGGYSGNPALYPLFYNAVSRDILIIHVNPIVRDDLPDRAASIENRLNEITFNSSLLDELRAIAFVKKLITQNWLRDEYHDRLKNILIHAIRADKVPTVRAGRRQAIVVAVAGPVELKVSVTTRHTAAVRAARREKKVITAGGPTRGVGVVTKLAGAVGGGVKTSIRDQVGLRRKSEEDEGQGSVSHKPPSQY